MENISCASGVYDRDGKCFLTEKNSAFINANKALCSESDNYNTVPCLLFPDGMQILFKGITVSEERTIVELAGDKMLNEGQKPLNLGTECIRVEYNLTAVRKNDLCRRTLCSPRTPQV